MGCFILWLVHIAGIHAVAIQGGFAIGQDLCKGHLSCVGRHFACFCGIVHLDLHTVSASTILDIGDLVTIQMLGIWTVSFAIDGGGACVVGKTLPVVVGFFFLHLQQSRSCR